MENFYLQMLHNSELLSRILHDLGSLCLEKLRQIPHSSVLKVEAVYVTHHAGHHQLTLLLRRPEVLDELENLVCPGLASPSPHPSPGQMLRQELGHAWLLSDDPALGTDSRDYGPVPLGLVHSRVISAE